MNDLIQRIKAYGIALSLKPDGSSLAYDYNEAVFDGLSDDKVNEVYQLIDDNIPALVEWLQTYKSTIIEKIKATCELSELLLGQDVELQQAIVVKVSELAVTFESDGILWQIDIEDSQPIIGDYQFKFGQVWRLNGLVECVFVMIMSNGYVKIMPNGMKFIKEEAF